MSFSARSPSRAWEQIPLGDSPQSFFWAWYKPAELPQGLVLRVPEEAFRDGGWRESLTVRNLLEAAGIDTRLVSTWSVYGVVYEGHRGSSPLLDQVIPPPSPGADPNIVVSVETRPLDSAPSAAAEPVNAWGQRPTAAPSAPQIPQSRSPSLPAGDPGQLAAIFDRIDADWQATLQLESQVTALRRQLADTLNRLNALNRDLSPDERHHGDRQDKSDWQTARRWLRDLTTRVSKCIKDQDLGETSTAGRRKWFEDIYQQFIAPRRAFEGMPQAQREFEMHRKTVQTLLTSMSATNMSAMQEGERRAQQILSRITAKVRGARTQR